MDFVEIAKKAKEASLKIADLSDEIKNKALIKIADKIDEKKDEIFEANKEDLKAAEPLVEAVSHSINFTGKSEWAG